MRPWRTSRIPAPVVALLLLAGCASGGARPELSRADAPARDPQTGLATWYADRFAGRATASGRLYDPDALTAAHRTLAFGTRVRVTNLENRRAVVVVITDRGPFRRGRIIDLSRRAAAQLGIIRAGLARVRIEPLPG